MFLKKYIDMSGLTRFKEKLDDILDTKADLVDGKVPTEQLPAMDVEVITYSETQPTGNWNIWEKKTQEDMDAYTYSDIGTVYEGPLTEIPASYKYNVRDLTSVILKEATSIGEDAFYAAYDLTYFSAPKCEVLEKNALRDCYRMTNAVLGNVKTVGEKALSDIGCTSLNLPQCETIGDMAFQASYDLREVVLGNCHSIGITAFGSCRSFRYLTIGYDGVCELGESAIPSEITQIRVPANQVDAYKSSPQWSSYASKIVAIS